MAYTTTTNIEVGAVIELHGGEFRDELLTFADAGIALKGTILARATGTGKLVPFAAGGSGGAEVPQAVLTYDVPAADAGDVSIRALVKGTVNKNRLIIAADGDGTNITNAILDQLRDVGIVPIDVALLGRYPA